MTEFKDLPIWVIREQDSHWLQNFVRDDSYIRKALEGTPFKTDEEYQAREFTLPQEIRLLLARARFDFLSKNFNPTNVSDYCRVFPPWFNRRYIDELGLSVRLSHALHSEGVYHVYQFYEILDDKLIRFPNLGQKSLNELHAALRLTLDDYSTENAGLIVSSISLVDGLIKQLNGDEAIAQADSPSDNGSSIQSLPDWVVVGNTNVWFRKYSSESLCDIQELSQVGIQDDISYQLNEFKLSYEKRLTLARYRYLSTRSVRPIREIRDFCLLFPPWLNQSCVTVLWLTVRALNCLQAIGCSIVADLKLYSDDYLLKQPNLGRGTLGGIKVELENILTRFERDEGLIPDLLPLKIPSASTISTETEGFMESSAKDKTLVVDIREDGLTLLTLIKRVIGLQENKQRRDVLTARLGLYAEPLTLQEATSLSGGVTRERIRQIERRAIREFLESYDIITDLSSRFDTIRKDMIVPLTVESLSLYDDWFRGLEVTPWIIESITNIFEVGAYRVHHYEQREIIAPGSWQLIDSTIKATKQYLKSARDNRINKSTIRNFVENLVGVETPELVNFIVIEITEGMIFMEELGEERLIAHRASMAAHVVQILNSSEIPLHLSKIHLIIKERFKANAEENFVRNQAALSAYLYAPSTFGLIKHLGLSDDEVAEVQNITYEILAEQPERQWHCHEIIEVFLIRMPAFIGLIDSYKLSICLSLSEKFKSLGRMIFALAGETYDENLKRIDFFKFVEAVLDRSDKPMHRDEILGIIKLERGLSAFSQILPLGRLVSVGVATWALIDKHLNLSESEYEVICKEVRELLTSRGVGLTEDEVIKGLPIGSIALRFAANPYALFSLMTKAKIAKKEDRHLYLKEWTDSRRMTQKKSILEAIQHFSKSGVFTLRDVYQYALSLYGYPFDRAIVHKFVVDAGGVYKKESNVWELKA